MLGLDTCGSGTEEKGEAMTESISASFLNMDAKKHWSTDPRLERLADYIDHIFDPKIKSFTKFLLANSDGFWIAPVDNPDNDNTFPPDEYEPGGLVRSTRRAARSFIYLSSCMNFSIEESDCGVAALLLRNCTKPLQASPAKGEYMFDPFHLYTIDSFIDRCLVQAQQNQEDTGSVLEIAEEALALITRLIHTSDGIYSIIPETFPNSALEKTVHMATLMGSLCHDILDGEKPNVESPTLDD
jgi:hypothetical protein